MDFSSLTRGTEQRALGKKGFLLMEELSSSRLARQEAAMHRCDVVLQWRASKIPPVKVPLLLTGIRLASHPLSEMATLHVNVPAFFPVRGAGAG